MDKRLIVTVGIVIAFLVFSYPVLAAATAPPVIIEKDGQGRPTIIIEQGRGKDTGLIKVTQIHYARPNGKVKPLPTETCYKLAGWKWTSPITYTINSDEYSTFSTPIEQASSAWADETSKISFTSPVEGQTALSDKYTDRINSILFGDYPDSNVIAVTITWYTRGTKIAVESDILFNTDFSWGNADLDGTKMDLQNIATHEIGHTLGLSDTYTTLCTAVTMYGYSTEGETDKRTLEQPDINGLVKIYGL